MFKFIKKYSVQEKRFEFGGWKRAVIILLLLVVAPAIITTGAVYYHMSQYSFYEYLNTFGNENFYKSMVIIAGLFFQYAGMVTIMFSIASFFFFWRDGINKTPTGTKIIQMVLFSGFSFFTTFLLSILFFTVYTSSGTPKDLHDKYMSYSVLVIRTTGIDQCEFKKGGYGRHVFTENKTVDFIVKNITYGDSFPCDYDKISKMVESDFEWLKDKNNEINALVKNDFSGNNGLWINKEIDLKQGKYRINIIDVQDTNK